MPSNDRPTQRGLLLTFSYDPETGVLIRLRTGRVVGNKQFGGQQVDYDGKKWTKSHIIWMMVHGVWPENEIDHWDKDKKNHRLVNLREATRQQQNANRRKQTRKSTSKYMGVKLHHGRWEAFFPDRSLGHFDSEEDAARVRDAGAIERWGTFANLNFKENKNAD